jgi:predicted nucleic-acid-binding Zn-ribbon protein
MSDAHTTTSLAPCRACGGTRIYTHIQGPYADVLTPLHWKGFDPPKSPLIAMTCTTCGLTEFYAMHPEHFRTQQ